MNKAYSSPSSPIIRGLFANLYLDRLYESTFEHVTKIYLKKNFRWKKKFGLVGTTCSVNYHTPGHFFLIFFYILRLPYSSNFIKILLEKILANGKKIKNKILSWWFEGATCSVNFLIPWWLFFSFFFSFLGGSSQNNLNFYKK